MGCLAIILIVMAVLAVDFLLCSGLVWLICFAFGWVFTWKVAIGAWAVVAIAQSIFAPRIKKGD